MKTKIILSWNFVKHIWHMIERKIDTFLKEWKEDSNKKPLIVKGARQIGKTFSIMQFATSSYKYVVNINFALQEKFKTIFNDGFDVDSIINNITLLSPSIKIEAGNTLIFFDELQACPNCATSLKSFAIDGRYDVICSGSLMGINYHEIESNSVGYKTDYEMHSLDFEEFLWAKGYSKEQVESIYSHLKDGIAFSSTELEVWFDCFKEYMIVGGMPEIVQKFVSQKNYSGILEMQKQLLLDYEEDITKYAFGLDKGKIKNVYNNISVFLAKENKKYQISKISRNARNRDYIGTTEWLADAGIISPCYCLETLELPLKGNYNPQNYKLYYKETSLLIASMEEEAQEDLRANKNFNTYKGAIYENIVADALTKQGYSLYFYKNEKSTVEMDFFIRDTDSLIPIEVKAKDNPTPSLNKLIENENINYGIKLCYKNFGFNGKFYAIPYFAVFCLKRWIKEKTK